MAKASEWAERVKAWRASGKSAAEYCKGRDFSVKNLQWWSSHFQRNGMAARAPGTPRPVPLARVVRTRQESAPRTTAIVVCVGDARVEVAAGVDRSALSAVLEALLGARGRA